MALSGNHSGVATHVYNLSVEWSARQDTSDITLNRSYVTARVYLHIGAYGSVSSQTSKSGSISINGTSYSFNKTPGSLSSGKHLIATKSVFIYHENDGTKSFNLSATYNLNINAYGYGWVGALSTGSKPYTLNTIPRTSSFTIPSSFTMGNAFTVSIDRASSAFTHWVILYDGSTYLYTSGNNVGTSTEINVELSTLAERIPSASSKVFTVQVDTYNGSAFIGRQTKSITGLLPDTVKPSFSSISDSEYVSDVNTKVGAYVQNKSRLSLGINGASGIYGSTIKSYRITIDGHTINSSSGTTGVITGSGNITITARVTDTRDRYLEKTKVINVLPYATPQLVSISFLRSDINGVEDRVGEYVRVNAEVKVSSLMVGSTQKNSIWYSVDSKRSNIGYYAQKIYETSSGLTKSFSTVLSGYEVDYSFDFRASAGDVFGFGGYIVGIVPTGEILQHWGRDTTAFGKFIDSENYNVLVGSKGLHSDGDIVAPNIGVDFVVETGSNANGNWEKWNSGKLVQWGKVIRTVTNNQVVGSIYYGSTGKINYPKPFMNLNYSLSKSSETLTGINWLGLDNNGFALDGVTLRILGPIALNRIYNIHWKAVGVWK